MANASERQLGAFMILHAVEFGEPYIPNQDIAKDRNYFIHKGRIPTNEQAHKFASEIYATIHSLARKLCTKHMDIIQKVRRQEVVEKHKILYGDKKCPPEGLYVATSTGKICFDVLRLDNNEDFAAAFESFKTAQQGMLQLIPQMEELHRTLAHLQKEK